MDNGFLKVATTSPSFQERVCFTDHKNDIQEENRESVLTDKPAFFQADVAEMKFYQQQD